MAIPFLNNINLSDNQLLNAKLQVTGTAPTAAPGQIYFNSTENVAKYHNGTTWVDIPRKISVGGTDLAYSQAIDLVAGVNVGIAEASGVITISSTDEFQGTVTSVSSSTVGDALDVAVTNATTTPDLAFTWAGAVTDYVNGLGDLVAFPTIPTVPSNIVETVVTTNGTFIDLTPTTAASGDVTITADLSATGTPDATVYLRGDNAWEPISAIPGTYEWKIEGDTGGPTIVASGDTIDFAGGTNVTTALSGTTLTINATDTNENDYLTALTFNTGDGVLTATVQNQSDVTVDLDGRYLTGNETITLSGDVTGSGTTSIATTISAGAVDFAMLNPTDVITAAEGIENNDNDVTIPTSAAVKAYADSLIVGGLIYQGGYDATTNTPDLTTSPNSILKGWTYTVTVGGTFFGEQLRVGDVLIAEVDDPSALTDWTTVQNNIDLASDSQVGIGNVKASTADELKGIDVTYNASGTAFVGLDIDGLTLDTLAEQPSDYFLPIYDAGSGINNKAKLSELLAFANSVTSKAYTITDTDTITYPTEFALIAATQNDVIIQLVDTVTNETVYADVDRISTTQATITFATTPTNDVRVLVQKIG